MASGFKPVLGITMGDVCGVGPEVIAKALCPPEVYEMCSPIASEALLSWAMDRLSGSPVFFDVPVENEQVLMLAKESGFSVQREFTRMFLGEEALGGDPSHVLATSGPEKG